MRSHKLDTIAIFLITLILPFSACNAPFQPPSSDTSNSSKTITFWYAFPEKPNNEVVEKLTQQYNSRHSVHVEAIPKGSYSDLQNALDAAVKSGAPPTIAQMYEQQATDYQRKGNIISLEPFISDGDMNDFYPEFRYDGKIHGEQYMLPFNKSFLVLYYNADILQQEHITPPKTLEEFETALKKVTKPDVPQWGLSYAPDVDGWSVLYKALGGDHFISDTEKSAEFAEDSNAAFSKQALNEFLPLVRENAIHVVSDTDWQNDFSAKKSVFALASTTRYPALKQAIGNKFQFAELPIPAGRGGDRATVLYGTNLVIFSKADYDTQRAAWDYINFLTSKDSNIYLVQNTGYVPIRKSAFSSSALQSYYAHNPGRQAELQSRSISFVASSVPAWSICRDEITTAFIHVLKIESAVDAAFQRMTEQCQKALNSG